MAGGRVAGISLAAVAAVMLCASGASAKPLGEFKVVDGHLNQKVTFNSSGTRFDPGSGECWQFFNTHSGSTDYRLKAKGGTTEAKPFDDSIVMRGIRFEGTKTTAYTGHTQVQPGPKYDPDNCGPPSDQPTSDTSVCGTENVADKKSRIILTGLGGQPSNQAMGDPNGGLGPSGIFPGIFDSRLECPSDSYWSAGVFPAAGNVKRQELLRERGTVKLAGKRDYTGKQGLLCVCDRGPEGGNSVHVDWSLKLKPVGK